MVLTSNTSGQHTKPQPCPNLNCSIFRSGDQCLRSRIARNKERVPPPGDCPVTWNS